jgi:hypothetical protein
MAFTADFLCNTFKQELLQAEHDFGAAGETFHLALYDNSPTMNAGTTDYTGATSGELPASGNYSTTGNALTNIEPSLDTSTGITDFEDEVWGTATFTSYGALLYNFSHAGKAAVAVLWFDGAKTATAGDFTVQFPAAAAATAIIRIA